MELLLQIEFNFDTVREFLFHSLTLRALRETLLIAVLAMVLGIVLGTVLGVMRVSRNPVASTVASLYVWFWRGTPVILQLYLGYFGLRTMIDVDVFLDEWTRWRAGVIILALNEAAFMAEIVRAGIRSVESGQMDAAKSLGMTNLQAMRRIILPQSVRVMVPPTGNEFIAMLKNTALLVVLGVFELMTHARTQSARTFEQMEWFTIAAIWYLIIVTGFSFLQAELERWLAAGEREQPETLVSRVLGVMGGRRA
jgi:polar amino acid transport system permease protein